MLAVCVATYYNHDEGYARPPWRELCTTFGISRRTLARWLPAIAAAGIWHAEASSRRATRYRFPVGPDVLSPPRRDVHRGATSDTPEISTRVPPECTPGVPPVAPELTTETRDGCHTRDDSPPTPVPAAEFSMHITVDPVPDGATWDDYYAPVGMNGEPWNVRS
jgi:hypothetical protein